MIAPYKSVIQFISDIYDIFAGTENTYGLTTVLKAINNMAKF